MQATWAATTERIPQTPIGKPPRWAEPARRPTLPQGALQQRWLSERQASDQYPEVVAERLAHAQRLQPGIVIGASDHPEQLTCVAYRRSPSVQQLVPPTEMHQVEVSGLRIAV